MNPHLVEHRVIVDRPCTRLTLRLSLVLLGKPQPSTVHVPRPCSRSTLRLALLRLPGKQHTNTTPHHPWPADIVVTTPPERTEKSRRSIVQVKGTGHLTVPGIHRMENSRARKKLTEKYMPMAPGGLLVMNPRIGRLNARQNNTPSLSHRPRSLKREKTAINLRRSPPFFRPVSIYRIARGRPPSFHDTEAIPSPPLPLYRGRSSINDETTESPQLPRKIKQLMSLSLWGVHPPRHGVQCG